MAKKKKVKPRPQVIYFSEFQARPPLPGFPEQVVILGKIWRVTYGFPIATDPNVMGVCQWNPRGRGIFIDSALERSVAREVLFHEMMHAYIKEKYGGHVKNVKGEEEICDFFADAMLDLAVNNPNLVAGNFLSGS